MLQVAALLASTSLDEWASSLAAEEGRLTAVGTQRLLLDTNNCDTSATDSHISHVKEMCNLLPIRELRCVKNRKVSSTQIDNI